MTTTLALSPPENLDVDRQIVRRLLGILPRNGTMHFLRHHHFGEAFERHADTIDRIHSAASQVCTAYDQLPTGHRKLGVATGERQIVRRTW